MKKTPSKLSAVAAVAVAILALSACGKNMNLSLKDKGKNGGSVGTDVGSDNKTGGDNKKIIAQQGDAYPDTDGKLQPLSIYDMGDTESPIMVPYLNKIEITDADGKKVTVNSVTQIGDPAGISARSNLVFRAIKYVPKKDAVKSIGEFSITLHDVRLLNAKGVDHKILASQLLCLMDVSTGDKSRACTGEKDGSDASNINAPFFDSVKGMTKDFATQAVDPEKGADIKLDLKKAFGLEGKKVEEQMDWIMNNTTLYSGDKDAGYRKFRFVVANNVYVGSGLLVLQFEPTVVDQSAAGDPAHGPTDKQSALQAQLDAKKAADDAATAAKKKADDDAAAELAKKNAAPANLKYAISPLTLTKDVAMDTQTPTSEGGVITDCKSATQLPAGLALGSNCAISGTPTAVQAPTEYDITATNAGGNTSTKISIAVVEAAVATVPVKTTVAPANLSYAGSPFSFTKGTAIASQSPTATGDAITGCTSSPELPAGLVLGTDCVISGTPTAVQPASPYAITATNAGGLVITNISIAIVDVGAGTQTNTTDLGPIVTEHVTDGKTRTTENPNAVDITLSLYDKEGLLNFDVNKSIIHSDDLARLVKTAQDIELLAGGKVKVLLTGRTSITKPKPPMTNEKLAKARAEAVRKVLRDNAKTLAGKDASGKDLVRIKAVVPTKSWCGNKKPECDHDRRVDLEIKFSDDVRKDTQGLADLRSKLSEALMKTWDPKGAVNKDF
ncbi:MAG: putative Ig domain-containing protein [Bdellovibrionales bacterium]|nr:putative Ig domain-containing protein [Bdellovibrionales bacterium]